MIFFLGGGGGGGVRSESWSKVKVKFSGRLYVYIRYKEVVYTQNLNKYTK